MLLKAEEREFYPENDPSLDEIYSIKSIVIIGEIFSFKANKISLFILSKREELNDEILLEWEIQNAVVFL